MKNINKITFDELKQLVTEEKSYLYGDTISDHNNVTVDNLIKALQELSNNGFGNDKVRMTFSYSPNGSGKYLMTQLELYTGKGDPEPGYNEIEIIEQDVLGKPCYVSGEDL